MLVADDGHITTLAVDPAWHRHRHRHPPAASRWPSPPSTGAPRTSPSRCGSSNDAAQALYRAFGFAPAGIRKGYYAETNEDALVMWANDVDSPGVRRAPRRGLAAGRPGHRPIARGARPMTRPSSAGRPDPRHRDVVRRDRGRRRRGGHRRCCRRSSAARSTSTPASAASCPRSPAGPTSSSSRPSSPRRSSRPGSRTGRSTARARDRRRRRHQRPRPGRRAARRRVARPRRWRWCGTCRSSPSTTSRPTSTPPSSRSPTSSCPLVVLLVSGGHTLLVPMEGHGQLPGARLDHRRRRRRGLRQGRPLPRPRLPGRSGHRPARRRGRPRGDPLPPADARRRPTTSPSAG